MLRSLSCAVALAAVTAFPSIAVAAGENFCRNYTDAALRQVRAVHDIDRCNDRLHDSGQWDTPRWSREYHVHFDWCRGASRDAADSERDARRDFLDRCRRD